MVIKENTSKFVKSTHKSRPFDSSGVTRPTQIDISVLDNMYRETKLKRVTSEIEEGNEELRTNEGNQNFLAEKNSSGSCQDKQVSNSGLVMTEIQALKVLHEDQNNTVKSNILLGESCTLGENQTETRALENTIQDSAVVKRKMPALTGETKELKDNTTVSAFDLDRQRSSTSNEMTDVDLVSNKTRKGFKMRHFKKSFYNMVVIWFLMLLCYLPGICTSTVFMLVGRS